VKRLYLDGSNGTVTAVGGTEQCVWHPFTGKIYQDIPLAAQFGSGVVMRIDPKTMTVETNYPIPPSDCVSPMGIAVGIPNQLLLGCNQNGSSSAVIDATTGKTIKALAGLAGTDEVWFNWRDLHYVIPHCPLGCRSPSPTAPEEIAFVDGLSLTQDPSIEVTKTIPAVPNPIGNMRRIKSVASDPITNKIYIPIPAPGGPAPVFTTNFCSTAPKKVGNPTDANGCVAIFTTTP
jgi:hypothetical protein